MQTPLFALLLMLSGHDQVALDTTQEPITLWHDFTTVTTKAEIKAFKQAQVDSRVEVYPGCKAEMLHKNIKNRLVSIVFLGQDRAANCFARMYTELSREHGKPELKGTTFGSVIGYGSGGASINSTSVGILNIWRVGEKKIKLVKSPGDGYNLIFTIQPDKYIY